MMTREELKNWLKENIYMQNGKINGNKSRENILRNNQEVYSAILEHTCFLSENVTFYERLYCLTHDIIERPKCKMCKAPVRFKRAYMIYCSNKCSTNDPEIIKKNLASNKKTNLERRGVENPFQDPKVRKKIAEKNLLTLGVENPFASPIIQEVIKQTNLVNLGFENPFSSPVVQEKMRQKNILNLGVAIPAQSPVCQEKARQTSRENWGTDNPMQSEIVKEILRKSNNDSFGYDWSFMSPEVKEKIKETNLSILGVGNPLQSPEVREKGKRTLFLRIGSEHNSNAHISKESLRLLNDKEWLSHRHLQDQIPMRIISQELGVSETLAAKYAQKHSIKVRLFPKSQAEKDLIEFIDLPCVLNNTREIISPQELDIYLPDYNLAIEYNGDYHHADKEKDYHLNKTIRCEQQGIQLFHIFESEWENPVKKEIWKSLINSGLNRNQVVTTNDIRKVDFTKEFLEENHLEGFIESKFNLGLFYNDELISLSCFTDNHLLRFCNKVGYLVINGLELLLNTYGKDIVYYANRRWNYLPNCKSTVPSTYCYKQHVNWDCGNWVYFWRKPVIPSQ